MTKAFGIPVLAPSVRPALTVAYEQTEIILDRLDPFLSERQGSTGPFPARGRRTQCPKPSRNGAAHACRVVPRSLPHVPGGSGAARCRALIMTSRTEH